MRADAIPGVAAGVVCGGRLAWAHGYGVMALDDQQPVTPASRFRIASITKLFTAAAIMKLSDAGRLELDDPVSVFLPWFTPARAAGGGSAPVTIHDLLTHTSGLPRDSRLTDFTRRFQPSRAAAIAAMPSETLRTAPGSRGAYSNLGYGVLGEIIAEASGTSFRKYVEREILAPLDMSSTLVHPRPHDDVAYGHGPRRAAAPRERAGFWKLGFATPAGGMASSVVDLARFVGMHLAPYRDEPSVVIVAPQSLREMHRVQHMVDPGRGGYGLAWGVEISGDQHVIYHGGELPEQTSFLLIDLRAQIGIIVLTNAQDVDANGIAQDMLRYVRAAVDPAARVPVLAIPPG